MTLLTSKLFGAVLIAAGATVAGVLGQYLHSDDNEIQDISRWTCRRKGITPLWRCPLHRPLETHAL